MKSEKQINSVLDRAQYLYFRGISEPRDNSLRLIVEEATANPFRVAGVLALPEQFAEISRDASLIEAIEGCRSVELQWDHYVAYLITEEVVGSAGDHCDEVYVGNLFRVYSKSHFLDYLGRNTGGHIKPVMHYKLICLNHLIDVASYGPPKIRLLDETSEDGRKMRRAN